MNSKRILKLWLAVLPIVLSAVAVAYNGNTSYQSYYHRYLEIIPQHLDNKGRNGGMQRSTVNVAFVKNQKSTPELIALGASPSLQQVEAGEKASPQGDFTDIDIPMEKVVHRVDIVYGGGWVAVANAFAGGDKIRLYMRGADSTRFIPKGEISLKAQAVSLRFHWYKTNWELLVGTSNNEVFAYSIINGVPVFRTFRKLQSSPSVLTCTQDNAWLIAGSTNIELVPMDDWQKSYPIGLPSPASAITVIDDSHFVVGLLKNLDVLVFSTGIPTRPPIRLTGNPARVNCLVFCKGTNCLIAGDESGNMTLWKWQKEGRFKVDAVQVIKAKQQPDEGHVNGIGAMALSLDQEQKWLASVGIRGALYLWNTESLLRGARL